MTAIIGKGLLSRDREGSLLQSTSMSSRETPLTGGQMNAVVRGGDTVRRSTAPWTPSVHSLLRHLDTVGPNGAPRVLGMDQEGREILSFLPGEAGFFSSSRVIPAHLWSDQVLTEATTLLRRYHDASESFIPDANATWQLTSPVTRNMRSSVTMTSRPITASSMMVICRP